MYNSIRARTLRAGVTVIGWVGAASAWDVVDEPRWGEHVVVDAGIGVWTFDQGLFFPVEHDGKVAGFVAVGPGRASVPFAEEAIGWWVAERLQESATDPWIERFDLALSVGARPQDVALWALPVADLRRGGVSYRGADGQENVVVTGFDYAGALGRAREALQSRVAALARAGVDPNTLLRLEARDPIGRWLGEVHGERRYTPLLEPAVRTFDDRWLSFSVDPAGLVDPEWSEVAFVHGTAADDGPRWTTLTGALVPDRAVRITSGRANVVLSASTGSERAADVSIEALVTLSGAGRVLPLRIPMYVPNVQSGSVVVPRAFQRTAVRIEPSSSPSEAGGEVVGAPLEWIADGYGPWRDDRVDTSLYVLPDGVATADVRAHLAWTDAWPMANTMNLWEWASYQYDRRRNQVSSDPALNLQSVPEWVELGRRVVDVPIWPTTSPWAARYPIRSWVGSTVNRWRARSGAGEVSEDPAELQWRYEGTSRHTLSVGEGPRDVYAAARGFPEISVDRTQESDDWPVLVRAVLNFYADGLGRFPLPKVEVVRDVDRLVIGLSTPADPAAAAMHLPTEVAASPGTIVVKGRRYLPMNGASVASQPVKRAAERGFAEALAAQWMDQLDYGPRDVWISGSVSAYLRDRFVYEGYGDKVADRWRVWEDSLVKEDPTFPSQGPYPLAVRTEPWADRVGGRLLLDLVEPRIGEEALLAGVVAFLEGGDPTTEAFTRALSEASHVRLDGLFDTFFVAGLRPSLTGTAVLDAERLRVTVAADRAIGNYEVPVQIRSGRVEQVVWVPVRDGVGMLEVSFPGNVREVVIDPRDALGQRRTIPLSGR